MNTRKGTKEDPEHQPKAPATAGGPRRVRSHDARIREVNAEINL